MSTRHLIIEELDLPHHLSIKQIFAHFVKLPYSLLLDSTGSTKSDSQFDIMYWQPESVVVAEKGKVYALDKEGQNKQPINMQPLHAVEQYVSELKATINLKQTSQKLLDLLPSVIGAAGYAGYDLGRYYESLPSKAANDLHTPDMVVGIYSQSLIYDSANRTYYYSRLSDVERIDFSCLDIVSANQFQLLSDWQSNVDETQYHTALANIHQYLVNGDCYQVNFSQRFNAKYEGCEWQAYQRLIENNEAPFSAFFKLPLSTILSISPERFLKVKENKVETKPIKGTRPRHSDKQKDLLSWQTLKNSEKDRAENLMIVDLLRNDLSKHCQSNSVNVPTLFDIESYSAVHHLVSTVTGQLKPSSSAMDLFAGAFPGGSITGAPKIRAMEIIDELEPHRRNVYCGSLFYFDILGNLDSNICIRTLLAENNTLYCNAGGGIVFDSNTKDEYKETYDKVSKILPVLSS